MGTVAVNVGVLRYLAIRARLDPVRVAAARGLPREKSRARPIRLGPSSLAARDWLVY
ncbi:MAG: hypothetical protein KDA81_16095 [Planctomycetaceae bacterium]|nr:hypothetical protein [Planctomycetaceae bacterium]